MTLTISHNEPSALKKTIILSLLISFFILQPDLLLANPVEKGVDWVMDLLTSGIARSAAIIGVCILGYMAWAGKLTGEGCFRAIGGIVLVFGGATLVDLIIAAVK